MRLATDVCPLEGLAIPDGAWEPTEAPAPAVEAVSGLYDCSPFSLRVHLAPYSAMLLSQDPPTGAHVAAACGPPPADMAAGWASRWRAKVT